MKNIRDSANIIRSMARQYQAVIDLAEHVGEGDKLEASIADAEKRLKVEEGKIERARQQLVLANKDLDDVKGIVSRQREILKEVEQKTADAHTEWEGYVQEAAAAAKKTAADQAELNTKINAAQKKLLTLQGTINEKKDELSRLQDKINEVHAALSKVA